MPAKKEAPKTDEESTPIDAEVTAEEEIPAEEAPADNTTTAKEEPATDDKSETTERPSHKDEFVDGAKKAATTAGKAIGTAGKKATEAVKSVHKDPLFTVRFLDKLLDWTRTTFPADMFDSIVAWFTRYGHTGIVLSAVVALVFWGWAWLRPDTPGLLSCALQGVGYAILIVVLQYTATRFLDAGQALVKSSPSKLGSAAFLDSLALLAEISGIIAFFVFLAQRQWSMFFIGLGVLTLCDSVAFVALHPSIANIKISEKTAAGEEAIGILSFFIKAVVKIVPIVFGVGSFVGLLVLTISTVGIFPVAAGKSALKMIVACACLPFFSYILFAVYHLAIDVLRAILVLPAKIDAAAGK